MGSESLTPIEATMLAACEADIQQGMERFLSVGSALLKIRDRRLYRATDVSFAAYCGRRWKMSSGYAYRLISACEVAQEIGQEVSPLGDSLPTSERQVRPLTQLETAEERREAWREAVETAPADDDGEPIVTAEHVAQVVNRRKTKAAAESTPGVAEPEETWEADDDADDPPAEPGRVETGRVEGLLAIREEIFASFASSPKRYDAIAALNRSIELVRILEGRQ